MRSGRHASFDSIHRILCLALTGQSHAVAWSALSPADWQLVGRIAETEGVAPLLYRALEVSGWPEEAPVALRLSLAKAYYTTAAHNLLLYQELSRILTALSSITFPPKLGKADGEGIGDRRVRAFPVVVLKGAALAATLYPSIALRPLSDLDLLVPRQRLETAMKALQFLGYRKQKVSYHVVLRGGPQHSVSVELHWSLIPGDADRRSSSLAWFWAQTEPFAPQQGMLTLTPTAHLLYLAAHLMLKHGEAQARLLWFYDIHLLINRWGERVDWDELLEHARKLHWVTALHTALQGLQERFGTSLPQGFLNTLTQIQDQRTRLMQREVSSNQMRVIRVWVWDSLKSLSWRMRLRLTWGLICPSPAYMRRRYNPRPEWLWPLCYPHRWLDILREGLFTALKLALGGRRGEVRWKKRPR